MRKDKTTLTAEFNNLKKDWLSVYNWESLSAKSYLNDLCEILVGRLDEISNNEGLRTTGFRVTTHTGTIELMTDIDQITEKRICRALFNDSTVPIFKKFIDYEVPFKEKQDSRHGDIDLLASDSTSVFIIEAKKSDPSFSVLKAILQAFSYSILVNKVKGVFFREFELDVARTITPTVLIFEDSECARELRQLKAHPSLSKLLDKLNDKSRSSGIGRIRFFSISTNQPVSGSWFREVETPEKRHPKILFRDEFSYDISEIIY